MKVVIIGSGNVATVLGKLIFKAGHEIIQIAGRNKTEVSLLADEFNASAETNLHNIFPDADIYIIAVSDDAVKKVAESLQLNNKLIVHTSGSLSKNILKKVSKNYGVIYPLQSLQKEIKQFLKIPWLIDGSSKNTINTLIDFAQTLSSIVQTANDEQRLKLHIAAVISSNFTNHLYALAETFCANENISFLTLLPLIEETTNRLKNYPSSQMQTGPAFRGDIITIKKHLRVLKNYPEIKKIYKQLSESILHQKNSPPVKPSGDRYEQATDHKVSNQ